MIIIIVENDTLTETRKLSHTDIGGESSHIHSSGSHHVKVDHHNMQPVSSSGDNDDDISFHLHESITSTNHHHRLHAISITDAS